MTILNTFANQSGQIPLSQLDSNFATPITIGTTPIILGDIATTITGLTLAGADLGTPTGNLANCIFPTLNQNTTGTASNVTGVVAVGNGGTGATTNAGTAYALKGANADITSISGLTTALSVTQGGTGVTTSTGTGSTVLSASPTFTGTVNSANLAYTGTLTGGTGAVAIGTNQIYKDASGNVGIGTSSPTAKAQIGDSTVVTTNRLVFGKAQTASESNLPAIGQQSAGVGNDLALAATSTSANVRFYIGASINSGEIGTGSNTERMRINSSGNVGIGTTSPNASAILDAQSTTKGVRFPNMTTTQKNAVATPPAGLVVFDTTLSKLCVYSGATWQTITSV